MQLPGRLSASTLGDLLGALHRARTTGTLELSEIRGPRGRTVPGRLHWVHLRDGLVASVDTSLPVPLLGEVRSEIAARIEALFALEEARIAFRTARPLGPAARVVPLGPGEFLHGRPRARDRGQEGDADPPCSEPRPLVDEAHARACGLLGVDRGAAADEVRRAFRRLAGTLHPDRVHAAPAEEQRRRAARLAELSAAYHLLVA